MGAVEPTIATGPAPTDVREEALRCAGVGLFRFTFDGTIIDIDHSTMRILEIDDRFSAPADVIGINISDLYEHVMPLGTLRNIIAQDGRAHNLEYPLITRRGNQKWVLHNSFPVVGPGAGQACVQSIIHDITENVLARRALWESEARFRCIFEQASVGIVHIALDGHIVESNDALLGMLGYVQGSLGNRPFAQLGHPEDQLIDRDLFQALLSGERDSYQVTKRFVRHDERPLWCQLTFSLIRNSEGHPSFAIGILEDITAQEEHEQAKSRFLSVLTHELRTPLTNIMGWAREAQEMPELVPRALDVIMRNADSQVRALNNLLEVSRLFYGRFTLQCEPADLREITRSALAAMQSMAHANGIELVAVMPHSTLPVFVDKKRLREMVCNLLDNALKFTSNGGTVTVSACRHGRSIRLDVRDTGLGILPEQIPLLFNPFPDARGEGVTGGLRLGLALVKSIVELHGGSVVVESAGAGHGSIFSVILPSAE